MILVLCGKSGSGKDTVAQYMEEHSVIVDRLCSTTSRPPREGENEGVEYNFISRNDFEKAINTNKWIEYRAYDTLVNGIPDTWYYGTAKTSVDEVKDKAGIKVLIKDLDGAKDIKDYCTAEGIDIRCVLIDTPDALRTERAMNRGSFNDIEWNRRLAADARDFTPEKIKAVIDYTVKNEDVTIAELSDKIYKYAVREDALSNSEVRKKPFNKVETIEDDYDYER